jgi:hypothetical protein
MGLVELNFLFVGHPIFLIDDMISAADIFELFENPRLPVKALYGLQLFAGTRE